MASIRKVIRVDRSAEEVWAAIRDVGAVHQRLARGFVTDTRMEGEARIVTFANGLVARELIVQVDDVARRLAYAAVGGRLTHHNASFEVYAEGEDASQVVWVADLLPDELGTTVEEMMDQGCAALKATLEDQ